MSLATLSDARASRLTAHEYARDSLRRAILRGDLETGSRVPQVAWARRLEVSTTPIREALRDLATEGMVELDAHRGAFVNRLTFEQVQEIYHIRQILEPAAMRDAARLTTPASMARIEHLHALLGEQVGLGRWAELHCEFHDALLSDVPSERLKRTIINLRNSAAPYVAAARRRQGTALAHAEEHRDLLDALRARDEERAAAVALQHLESTMTALAYERAATQRQA
ncbi:MAG TPA: GntR family transcriptional regulator [Euzebyales bacterium]|nr:GntR family transcriptional regulator [Euzebyales bacterium]